MEQFSVNKEVVTRTVTDEQILLDLSSGEYYSLNSTGAFIWQLLVERTKINDIISSFQNEYEVSENMARNDVTQLINDLRTAGLLLKN